MWTALVPSTPFEKSGEHRTSFLLIAHRAIKSLGVPMPFIRIFEERAVSEPEMINMGGMIAVCWPPIDLRTLDWWPMEAYSPEATTLPIVQDADRKTWLVQQDAKGDWREMIDADLLGKVVPVRWAVPTDEMVQALAFG